jgi:putative membrane protein
MKFLVRLLINALALWVAAQVIPRMVFDGGIAELALVALGFGLVNAIIRPVVRLLTLPVTLMTFGLFGLVVNGLMLLLVANFADSLEFEGGFGTRILAAVAAAIVVSVVSAVASALLPDGR